MATHFVGAVKEHADRLSKFRVSQPTPDELAQMMAAVARATTIPIVKSNNVEFARFVRNNPIVIKAGK
jgi:hypothetical protein